MKLTPSLSKNSAKIPWVPLLPSSEHVAEMDASTEALPAFFVEVLLIHSKLSVEERVGKVAFQCLIPLDQALSAVSNPVFFAQFAPQFPSFEPQEAYPITLLMFVRNSVSSSKITDWFIAERLVFAAYKSSFQNLYPELLRFVAKSRTKFPLEPIELFALSINPSAVSIVYPVNLVTKKKPYSSLVNDSMLFPANGP